MLINTKEFQPVVNKILNAVGVDKQAGSLELKIKGEFLYLSVTNGEFYVSIKFPVADPEPFCVVVDANQFLSLVSGITSEDFILNVNAQKITILIGKSKYELPVILNGGKPLTLDPIFVNNVTVDMPVSNDILNSILTINSKEIAKTKAADTNELRKLYFVSETGCFTFAVGSACVNSFTLDKPIKLLLNDKLVKLFKLFSSDTELKYGYDPCGSTVQTKVSLQADNVYLAAVINSDDNLVTKIEKACVSSTQLSKNNYANSVIINNSTVSSAISRLMTFNKASCKATSNILPASITFDGNQVIIKDLATDAVEYITSETNSIVPEPYTMVLNLTELKSIIDSSKLTHSTINCGDHRAVVIVRGTVSNILCELQPGE